MPKLTLVMETDKWDGTLAEYVASLRAGGKSAGTIRLRLSYLRRFAAGAPRGPFSVTADDLISFLAREGWSAETRKSARAALRTFYLWAHDSGRLDTDPARRLPSITVPRGKPRPAPESIVVAALARADARGRLMVMLAAFAGLRCSEIARVHSRDLVGGSLRVAGKGGRVRVIPLHPAVARYVTGADGWLFPSPYRPGDHLRANSVSVLLRRLLGQNYSAHTLRHRFATKAYEVSRDLRAVQELLGHSKPETTAIYTALPDDALREAAWGAYVA